MYKQAFLPGFPEGAERIGDALSILEKDGTRTYFLGGDNYYSHPMDDKQGMRFVLASLMVSKHVRACDLEKAPLLIPHRTLMHWTRQYREGGSASFFGAAKPTKPRVMTAEKSAECGKFLDEGLAAAEVARRAGVQESTLRKAIKRQGVPVSAKGKAIVLPSVVGSSKSERSRADAEAAAPTSGSITVARRTCRDATYRARNCACAARPTTGSTMPWDGPSSSSPRRSPKAWPTPCSRTSCRTC